MRSNSQVDHQTLSDTATNDQGESGSSELAPSRVCTNEMVRFFSADDPASFETIEPELIVESPSMSFMHPQAREIAFIDPKVDDLKTLLAGIRTDVEVFLLTCDEPAPRQMARAVDGRNGVDVIHVIAHGQPGEVSFAAGALSLKTINQYGNDLTEIGLALNGGQLLLWSCEIGRGEHGENFVKMLALSTGAKIGTSTGLIGAAARGGQWKLDAQAGETNERSSADGGSHEDQTKIDAYADRRAAIAIISGK